MSRKASKNHKLKRRLRLAHHTHQGGKCAYCKRDMDVELNTPDGKQKGHGLTLEHILPQIYGGRNKLEETVGICANCNRKRSHRPLHWSVVWNVLKLKPKGMWFLIIKLHIINWWCFRRNSRGYDRFGAFHPNKKQPSSMRKQKQKEFIKRCKDRKRAAKLAIA